LTATNEVATKIVLWIVDDPYEFCDLAGTLEADGHRIFIEGEVSSAVRRLDNERIDLVLFDNAFARGRISSSSFQRAFMEAKERAKNEGRELRLISFEKPVHELVSRTSTWLIGEQGRVRGYTDVHQAIRSLVVVSGQLAPQGLPQREALEALQVAFRATSDEVLEWLAEHPDALVDMHWRDFEHLVAELFDRNGFEVTLTSASGDHGADLYVARHTELGALLYVVECKRYSHKRPVGPGLVRELRGVVDREGANAGVLVTTSFFSKGAYEEQRTLPFRISLNDNLELRQWLRGKPIF
jgi:hypothetical protein